MNSTSTQTYRVASCLQKAGLVETKKSGNCFIATLAGVLYANNLRVSLADIEMAFGPWKEVVGFLTARSIELLLLLFGFLVCVVCC